MKYLAGLVLPFLLFSSTVQAPADAQSTDILQKALTSHNPDTRMQAVVALSLASDRNSLLPLLIDMTGDKDVQVRIAAVAS
ncbi:MAG TPA: HEAT repeat domain-containing protein, partial [Bryobacteraceae bacterium]|nr:HEAT repeat domain-containing protein [Bryobacteraceae bacterium]